MRISDWSSDVFSSDLVMPPVILPAILLLSLIFAPLVRPRKNAGCARRHIAFARRWCSLWHIRSVNDKIRGRTGFPSHSGEGCMAVSDHVDFSTFMEGVKKRNPGQPEFVQAVQEVSEDIFDFIADRSEEHTSELQSLMRISYAVFCLKK